MAFVSTRLDLSGYEEQKEIISSSKGLREMKLWTNSWSMSSGHDDELGASVVRQWATNDEKKWFRCQWFSPIRRDMSSMWTGPSLEARTRSTSRCGSCADREFYHEPYLATARHTQVNLNKKNKEKKRWTRQVDQCQLVNNALQWFNAGPMVIEPE